MTLRDPSAYSTVLNFVNTGFKWPLSSKGSDYWDGVRTALLRLSPCQKISYGPGADEPKRESFDQARAALLAAFDWAKNAPGDKYWGDVYGSLLLERVHFGYRAEFARTAPVRKDEEGALNDNLERVISFVSYGFAWSQSRYGVAYWGYVVARLRQVRPVGHIAYRPRAATKEDFDEAKALLHGAFVWSRTKEGHAFWRTVSDQLEHEREHFGRTAKPQPAGLNPPGGHLKPIVDDPLNVAHDGPTVLLTDIIESDTGLKDVTDPSQIAAVLNFRVARLIRDKQAPTRPEHDNQETFKKRLVAAFSALAIYADVAGVNLIDAVAEDLQS